MHARPVLSTHPPVPPHPPTPPSGCRSMPSSAADNSIILHAKTASDVLAQSASHLCEQITSYRKTDFIFEGRCLRYFFPAPLRPLLLFPSFPSVSPLTKSRARFFFESVEESTRAYLIEMKKGDFLQRCKIYFWFGLPGVSRIFVIYFLR